MKPYLVKTTQITIKTWASDAESAKRAVMDFEGCPESAILSVRRAPSPWERKAELFREWWNNYLTVETFAEHYEMTLREAARVLRHGRLIHNDYVREN